MIDKNLVCVAGLPRAGSTLLCQLLAHHPDIFSDGHSSPLLATLNGIRHNVSQDHFMKAQMDVDFDFSYQRLERAFAGFVDGWFSAAQHQIVVDKNRGWLNNFDLLEKLDTNAKLLICIRDPAQIFGSVEAKHKKTLLLDFPDKLAHLSPYDRGDKLFAKEGLIGSNLHAIANLQDLAELQQEKFFFVVFEQLMQQPTEVMSQIFQWLGLKDEKIDSSNLIVRPHESDSYYNFKYPHKTHSSIQPPKPHSIPSRIEADIKKNFTWFYENFYPGLL